MKVAVFQPLAKDDYLGAIQYYAERSPQAAVDFENNLKETLSMIERFPEAFPLHGKQQSYRSASMRNFPFSVVYTLRENFIWIVAIAHQSRRPGYWKDRLKDV